MTPSEQPRIIDPAQLDAVTGELAGKIIEVCRQAPEAIALIAVARAQAHIVVRDPESMDQAMRAAHQMLRLYAAFLQKEGGTILAVASPLMN